MVTLVQTSSKTGVYVHGLLHSDLRTGELLDYRNVVNAMRSGQTFEVEVWKLKPYDGADWLKSRDGWPKSVHDIPNHLIVSRRHV